MNIFYLILGLVIAQRLVELIISHRNSEKLLARGGHEVGRRHYPLFIMLHLAWLVSLLVLVDDNKSINLLWILIFLALQIARVWVVTSLGEFWTTRIITVPNSPLIQHGPYRFCNHPNYIIVIGEIVVLPLAFGAWEIAIIFSILNGLLLMHRIKIENVALNKRRLMMSNIHQDADENSTYVVSSENSQIQ
tara:strand:- start:196 stop:768 length:573 start_codon:yes stop_codon:yes gene_type:complete